MADEFLTFPAGELHCRICPGIPNKDPLYLPRHPGEDLNVYLMRNILAVEAKNAPFRSLYLPYLPYARQDRITEKGEPFSLKVVGNILNTLKLKRLFTLDVHSPVAFACIDNLVSIGIDEYLDEMLDMGHMRKFDEYGPVDDEEDDYDVISSNYDMLIVPDAGAMKKLGPLIPRFRDHSVMIKIRDTHTGKLSIKGGYSSALVEGKRCLIVDDICDGGGTFILIAMYLKNLGAKSIDLAITHGIFSKGLLPLRVAGIGKIFCTNSIPQAKDVQDLFITDVKDILHDWITLGE
jgi:ribose-phosphate pyrophosphokinase